VGRGPDEVLAGLRRGDEDAFRQVASTELGGLYAIALGILGNRDDAEDACQEVFIRLHRAARRLPPATSLRAWLRRVCINWCLDEVRRRNRRGSLLRCAEHGPAAGPLADPESAIEDSQFRQAIRRALLELSPRQRAIFVLRHVLGCRIREIGQTLGCADGTVKVQLSRATRKLRELLRDWDPATRG
jgi:RNA polymerase sigma-70 factor (ECF subfamily)